MSEDAKMLGDVMAEALRKALNPAMNERLALQERPPGQPHARIPCVSPTGARFVAVVAASKSHPKYGRVIKLEDYQYPEIEWPQGMTVYMPDATGNLTTNLTPNAKQHLAVTTWQADLKRYVGQPFDPMIREDLQPQIKQMEAKIRKELDAVAAAEAAKLDAPVDTEPKK